MTTAIYLTALRAALVGMMGLFVCPNPATAQKHGGSITVGLELDIPGFDPLKVGVYDTGAEIAAALIFDTLTSLDDKGEAVPKLAISWTHSRDFRVWIFRLRAGVTFHDGSPFDAHAVAWNFARQKEPNNHCRCAFYVQNIETVDAIDNLTVSFRLREPQANFPALLAPPGVNNVLHSSAAVQKFGDDYNRHPVGTGPFVLRSWTSGDRMVVERNPIYWNKGHPYLDRVVLRPLPDAQARFASLQSGDIDLVWADEYEFASIAKARRDPTLAVHTYTGSGATVYAFNTKMPPFDDVRVRQALVMALDRATMSLALTNGLAKPATNPYGENSFVQCKDDGALPFDPKQARELLRAYGKPVEFKMIVTATPRGRLVGQVLQQFWKQIGATMEFDQLDQTAVVTRALARQFQLTPWRIIDLADPDLQMYANFHTGSPTALAGFSSPELDRLLDHARATVDQTARIDDYCAVSRLLNHEAPWFWTFQNTYFAVAKMKLEGLTKLYSGVIDVSDTWLE